MNTTATTPSLNGSTYVPSPNGHGPAPQPSASKKKKRRFQNVLTALIAMVATGAAAQGMWSFFGDVLHVTNVYERGAVFAVFEMALLVSALRARRARIDGLPSKKDDIAVWVFASVSGLLAASHETDWRAGVGRIALPLVAAYLFERAISAERDDQQEAEGKPTKRRINWRITPEAILIRLRLADPSDRDVAEAYRSRRIGRLVTLADRAHNASRWTKRAAVRRYRRALIKTNERLNLAADGKLVQQVQAGVALLDQGLAATAPAAVVDASPWAKALRSGGARTGRPVAVTVATKPVGGRPSKPADHSPLAIADAATIRARYPDGLPDPGGQRLVRADLGWHPTKATNAVNAYRAAADLTSPNGTPA